MKFSEQWLRSWVNPDLNTEDLCHQITMAGLEVDAIEPAAPPFNNVVVAEIVSAERHPDADKLQVCQVNTGSESVQIICGAANARAGLKVAAALVGAKLPGDFNIKKAKLRGVESYGMLCSEKELGLAEDADGIMELPADAPVGTDIRAYLNLDDNSIELGLTPNRSDCLSIAGIARDVGVLSRAEVTAPAEKATAAKIDTTFPVMVEAEIDCPRYVGRVIKGINRSVETPRWMQDRLRGSDIRSLDPVVDVTNYVLLELGQPMHAFDLNKLKGGIRVRHARAGEQLKLLNDQTVELTAGTLVIADESAPVALAGIMGGADTAVGEGTTDIFLESAFFATDTMAGRARSYGLHTDSSHRFERGVDPELQVRAMERATELLLEICGGEPGPITEVVTEAQLPRRETITLRAERIKRILGAEIVADEVTDILTRLGMQVETQSDSWQVTPPSYRFDMAIEVDLIEELARIHGYDNLPSHPPVGSLSMRPRTESRTPLARIRHLLVERDFQEVITYSFIDPALQQQLDPDNTAVPLANPISSEMGVMRTSLLPGLLTTLQYNNHRQQDRVRIFESGLRYRKLGDDIEQVPTLAGLIAGRRYDEQWDEGGDKADFYDLKADVEALLALSGLAVSYERSQHPLLHPGQAADILLGDKLVGRMGTVHPGVQKSLDLTHPAVVFELDLEPLLEARIPKFVSLSRFPSIRRDIALVLDEQISAQAVENCIQKHASEWLQGLTLFDVYMGKGIDSGRKSLALGLTLQDNSRTLKDDEIEAEITRIVEALNSELGATLRV